MCRQIRAGVWEAYNENPRVALAEWAKLIMLHPISYLQHRAAHMASLLQITCNVCDEIGITMAQVAEFNPAGSRRNVPVPEYEHWAQVFYKIIRPWIVLLLAAGLAAASGLRLWRSNGDVYSLITFTLSLSAILYTAGYSVIGLSDPFRYLYWLYSATGMAAVTSLSIVRYARPKVWTVSPGSAS